MKRIPTHSAARRPGFTLVELLVVIAIIAVLVSLTAAAVFRVMTTAPDVVAHNEIGQLSIAIGAAKTDLNGVQFLPSTIILREDGAYSTAAEMASLAFLQRAFSKRIGVGTKIDWNGDNTITSGVAWQLDGGQCLVFWLGGIPDNVAQTGTLGFSTNPANPGGSTLAGTTFKQPYFPFDPRRLVWPPAGSGVPPFPYYNDPYTPGGPIHVYAYMAAFPNTGYNTSPSDCAIYPAYTNVAPYLVNPNGFQIISAGKDGVFGLGGATWSPATGYGAGQSPGGSDDVSNFSQALLGAPQS
jgi:prepilin-type N-terminal cleavage/methylation domain-containing protein